MQFCREESKAHLKMNSQQSLIWSIFWCALLYFLTFLFGNNEVIHQASPISCVNQKSNTIDWGLLRIKNLYGVGEIVSHFLAYGLHAKQILLLHIGSMQISLICPLCFWVVTPSCHLNVIGSGSGYLKDNPDGLAQNIWSTRIVEDLFHVILSV